MEETRTRNTMGFTSEVEDEVVMEAVSHKLYRLIVNLSKKFEETHNKLKIQLNPFILVTL